jgi:hypothetical protein
LSVSFPHRGPHVGAQSPPGQGSAAMHPCHKGTDSAALKLPPLFPLPTARVRSTSPPSRAPLLRRVTTEPCCTSASEAGHLIWPRLHSSTAKAIAPPPSPRCRAAAFFSEAGRRRCSPLGFPLRRSPPSATSVGRLLCRYISERPSPRHRCVAVCTAVCSGCRRLTPSVPA